MFTTLPGARRITINKTYFNRPNIIIIFITLIILGTLAGCKYNAGAPAPVNPAHDAAVQPSSPEPTLKAPPNPEPAPAAPPVGDPVEAPAIQPEPTSADEKTFSWWFTRNQQHEIPAINATAAQLLAENNGFCVLPNNDKRIYLTFDEGYELGYTPHILDVLDRHQVKAAFFITGHFLNTQPDLVKRMQSSGHLVGNHTCNHPDLTTLSRDEFMGEIESLEQKFTTLTGTSMPRYLRPPMGNYSATSLKWANEMGYKTVFWSMAFHDWDPNKQPGADYSYQHVLDNVHPGAVILLHAVSQSNTEALERIIIDLQAQGYVFSTFQ